MAIQNKIITVLGLGIFGRTVALELAHYGAEVIAVDSQADNVQAVADKVTNAAIGDFTDEEFLLSLGVQNSDVVIIGTGERLESAVLAAMHCKRMNIPQIISKAYSPSYEEVLYEIGVHSVITPERDSARRLASKILRNHIEEVLALDDDTSLVEFKIPDSWIGKSVVQLDLRKKYQLNLIGSRIEKGEPLSQINVNEPLEEDIILVAIVNSHTFERYDYLGLL